MLAHHLIANAREGDRFVRDDRDRVELLGALVAATAQRLLAHCIMDTHFHVVVEGPADAARSALTRTVLRYTRAHDRRHRRSGPLLREEIAAMPPIRDAAALARAIRYVHKNPSKTEPPLVARTIDFPWSSARAFAGLGRTPFPNVAGALALLDGRAPFGEPPVALADLEPADVPCGRPTLLLGAVAQTFGLHASDPGSARRSPLLAAARATYVVLGRLESYVDRQLAAPLGRNRQRVTQLAAGPADLEAVRIARTLLRDPGLRARIVPAEPAGRVRERSVEPQAESASA